MGKMTAFHHLSLVELAEKIRTRTISPHEVVDQHLQRIVKLQPRLNAFVHIDEANGREQSRAAETAVMRGKPLGVLHGVPLTVKSCIDVAGWPCASGSLLRKENIPSSDAVLVQRLQYAGGPHGVRNRQLARWKNEQSVECRIFVGRIKRRRSSRDRGWMFRWRNWQRWRRLDSRAGTLLRN